MPESSWRPQVWFFAVPRPAANYRLTYDVDASGALPVSTRVTTSWTFRSAGPAGVGSVPLPLLSVDYTLPLDAANHPVASGAASFAVRQAHGVRPQAVTAFTVATSVDGGATWPAGDGAADRRRRLPGPSAAATGRREPGAAGVRAG